ncbi:MAG: hypothetical protein WBP26_00130 [Candidatus Saccharimonadales bacterium]
MSLEKLRNPLLAASAATIVCLGAAATYENSEPGQASRGETIAFDPPQWESRQDHRISCGVNTVARKRVDPSPESPFGDSERFTLTFLDYETGDPYGITVADLGRYTYAAATSDGQHRTVDASPGRTTELIIEYPGPYNLRFVAGVGLIDLGEAETGTDHVDFQLECIEDITTQK